MHARRARTVESRAGLLRVEFDRQVIDEATIRSELENVDGKILDAHLIVLLKEAMERIQTEEKIAKAKRHNNCT